MRICVIGGAGFIGSNLCDDLNRNEKEYLSLDNYISSRGNLYEVKHNLNIDAGNSAVLTNHTKGMDVIVHLAADGGVLDSITRPAIHFEKNVKTTLAVLESARENSVPRVIFASTGGAIMGKAKPPVDEKMCPSPISPYGASKLCGEGYCAAYSETYGINTTILRFGNVFGENSWHKNNAIVNFCKNIINGNQILINGDGTASRDFVYVGDIVDGIKRSISSDISGFNIIHLASGIETEILEVAKKIVEISGKQIDILHGEKIKGEVARSFSRIGKAREILGYNPSTNLSEKLELTFKWMENFAQKKNIF